MSALRYFRFRAVAAAVALGACGTVLAQSPATEAEPLQRQPTDRIERITHEDALARVDELRVAGQTQRIEVQPKTGAPAYQISTRQGPADQGAAHGTGSAGRSSWRLLNF
ncbi:MAG TPA: hypothetical protein PKC60_07865 [Hydrogenophaga sp.]|uniref:hypothetical protein n=1 Tax=Hydrogenophaga sp. TaxID=1904254 RepID=UPI002B5E66DA|nr:hypothetical protein [Hydrogenophaga sp.]HMN93132.1 hypothetical protein [Hydrogenophaga sp.]